MESEAGVPTRHTQLMLPRLYSFLWVTAGLSEGVMSSLCPMLYSQTAPWHQQMTTVSPPCARPFGRRAPWGALAPGSQPHPVLYLHSFISHAGPWLGKCTVCFCVVLTGT